MKQTKTKALTETSEKIKHLAGLVQNANSPIGYITIIAGLADMAVYSDSPNLSEHLVNPTFRTHDGESPLGCNEELR